MSCSRPLAAMLVAAAAILEPRSVLAMAMGSDVRTRVVADGVQLTLSVPKHVYPRNALVRVTITVEGTSRRTVYFAEQGSPNNGFQTPQVEVLGVDGAVVFPPALSMQFLPRPGQTGSITGLPLRQTVVWHEYVILRGRKIRAWLDIQHSSSPTAPLRRVVTPPLTLKLVSGEAPHVTLQVTGSRVEAVLHPVGRVHGPLVYMDSGKCNYPDLGIQYPEHFTWVPAPTRRLTLQSVPALGPCPDVLAWNALGGWVGEPVSEIDYLAG